MGDVYFARKDYELAIKFYGSVINVAKERKNTQLETDMKIKIGKAFYAKGEKDTATAFWGVSFTLPLINLIHSSSLCYFRTFCKPMKNTLKGYTITLFI
jgi:tetratricopeptide (TPR) repeat protein